MNERLRQDAELIVRAAIQKVSPAQAVKKALEKAHFPGCIFLAAVGGLIMTGPTGTNVKDISIALIGED